VNVVIASARKGVVAFAEAEAEAALTGLVALMTNVDLAEEADIMIVAAALALAEANFPGVLEVPWTICHVDHVVPTTSQYMAEVETASWTIYSSQKLLPKRITF